MKKVNFAEVIFGAFLVMIGAALAIGACWR